MKCSNKSTKMSKKAKADPAKGKTTKALPKDMMKYAKKGK